MFKYQRKKIYLGLLIIAISLIATNHASAELKYTLLEQFPGFFNSGSSPSFPDLLSAIYKFGIWTVGIAAFFMLTVGGFLYVTSAGNTSSISTAKKVIVDALLGLVMALTAYLILYVINPDLVTLNLNLISVNIEGPSGEGAVGGTGAEGGGETGGGSTKVTSSGGPCTGTNSGCCKSGTKCGDCVDCKNFSNSYANLCYKGASGSTGCKLNSALADKLNGANLDSVGAEVSEAWPPTVNHSSTCHQNGTCADVRCKKACKNETRENVKKIYDKLKATGLKVVFESDNCAPYSAIGIYCKYYSTMTAPSFHVSN